MTVHIIRDPERATLDTQPLHGYFVTEAPLGGVAYVPGSIVQVGTLTFAVIGRSPDGTADSFEVQLLTRGLYAYQVCTALDEAIPQNPSSMHGTTMVMCTAPTALQGVS
ncbi:hypothetical protein HJC99_06925 [Candidatus Saccharibacteria bacterium]|nr:hypothetical protein [Candidatus Saccharibacteria bacterium]